MFDLFSSKMKSANDLRTNIRGQLQRCNEYIAKCRRIHQEGIIIPGGIPSGLLCGIAKCHALRGLFDNYTYAINMMLPFYVQNSIEEAEKSSFSAELAHEINAFKATADQLQNEIEADIRTIQDELKAVAYDEALIAELLKAHQAGKSQLDFSKIIELQKKCLEVDTSVRKTIRAEGRKLVEQIYVARAEWNCEGYFQHKMNCMADEATGRYFD